MISFFRGHPDLLRLIQGFPKIEPETGRLLLRFVERALSEKNPDLFLRRTLEHAISRAHEISVEVVSVKKR